MDHQGCAAVFALLGCFWGSAASSADRNAPPPRTLRRSDVVFCVLPIVVLPMDKA